MYKIMNDNVHKYDMFINLENFQYYRQKKNIF